MLLWRTAFQFPIAEAGAVAKLSRLGVWLLLCPPVGWLLALGYRKEVAFRIADGVEPVLPDGRFRWATFIDGCKAAGVIIVHLCPMWALYWLLAADDLDVALTHWRTVVLSCVLFCCFLPITLPGVLLGLPAWNTWMSFSTSEVILLCFIFITTVFVLPAAFLQISLHRRFRSALRLDRSVALIAANPRAYCEAWAISIVATAAAGLSGPLMPWGIVWSYLVIGFAFNNSLATLNSPEVKSRFRKSRFFKEPKATSKMTAAATA